MAIEPPPPVLPERRTTTPRPENEQAAAHIERRLVRLPWKVSRTWLHDQTPQQSGSGAEHADRLGPNLDVQRVNGLTIAAVDFPQDRTVEAYVDVASAMKVDAVAALDWSGGNGEERRQPIPTGPHRGDHDVAWAWLMVW